LPKHFIKFFFIFGFIPNSFSQSNIELLHEIKGGISPKSIVHNGNGLFSAQNMMYRHTITVYNANGELLKTIKDKVDLNKFGFNSFAPGYYMGAPVEACFSDQGKYLWVSNYNMTGSGFDREGCDACIGDKYDPSFVYKINTESFEIENIVKVGAVPKFMAINEKSQKLLVTNWTSSDVSIIDLKSEKEVRRVKVGSHPRGIAISKNGEMAYITIMGSTKIATLNLKDYSVDYIENVGKSPRHLVLDDKDEFLYCAVNSSNKLIKINLSDNSIVSCKTNAGPRTMVLSADGKFLYVVNYFTDTFQKINAFTMQVEETTKTGHHPIGITANWQTSEIWVACYEGRIQIFKDNNLEPFDQILIAEHKPKIKFIPTVNTYDYMKINATKTVIKSVVKEVVEEVVIEKEDLEIVEYAEPSKCNYHLIIGSFSIKDNAQKLKNKMIDNGFDASLLPSANGKMTMVSIQCFENETQVESEKSTILNKSGQKGWVYVTK
jgi:YVTN family beta-propeller protein